MGQNQLLLALIFTAALSGGLGYFCGYCIGFNSCAQMFYKKHVKKEKE